MKTLLVLLLSFSSISLAEVEQVRNFESNKYQTHLLELYTSEGCSSCPPAEAWLRNTKASEFKRLSVIPLAFHVTYWDYIGWKDVFAAKQYDRRQRKIVLEEGGRTVYTPQFFIDSKTRRGIDSAMEQFSEKQLSAVKIKVELKQSTQSMKLSLQLKQLLAGIEDVLRVGVAGYQNEIRTTITDGENEGRIGQHQYVVRELQTAFMSLKEAEQRVFELDSKGKDWSGVVVFVESNNRVIEALDIPL